jgi:hypothetical protein
MKLHKISFFDIRTFNNISMQKVYFILNFIEPIRKNIIEKFTKSSK